MILPFNGKGNYPLYETGVTGLHTNKNSFMSLVNSRDSEINVYKIIDKPNDMPRADNKIYQHE